MNWRKTLSHRRRAGILKRPLLVLPPFREPRRTGRGFQIIALAVVISVGLHVGLAVAGSGEWQPRTRKSYNIRVVQRPPRPAPKMLPPPPIPEMPEPLAEPKPRALPRKHKPMPQPEAPPREVFGADKKTFTESAGAEMALRHGNTQLKEQENDYTPPAQVKPLVDAEPAPPPLPRRAEPKPRPRPQMYDLSQVTVRPRFTKRVPPRYTDAAQDEEVQGLVKVEVIIDTMGRPLRARIVKSLGYGLDQEVRRVVMLSRFSPAQVGGVTVKCRMIVPYRFRLD